MGRLDPEMDNNMFTLPEKVNTAIPITKENVSKVDNSPAPTQVSESPAKPLNKMTPDELAAYQKARLDKITQNRLTGNGTSPPYEAPEGTHWSYIGGNWKLYKNFGYVAPPIETPPSVGGTKKKDDTQLNTSLLSPTPLTPSLITPVTVTPPPPPAKTAPIDTVLFNDDSVPIEVMTDLIFENIGGQELINIARNDIINGQQISYSPIKNLSSIQQQYNPNNIVSLQSTSDKYFANFSIKFEEKVPNAGNGPNGQNVYIDQSTGDLIIEAVNTASDEQIDVQIAISGTIYEADI